MTDKRNQPQAPGKSNFPSLQSLEFSPEQFKSLQRTLLVGSVVTGLLAAGRLPLNAARLAELQQIIDNVEEFVL